MSAVLHVPHVGAARAAGCNSAGQGVVDQDSPVVVSVACFTSCEEKKRHDMGEPCHRCGRRHFIQKWGKLALIGDVIKN
jgi:hypothetical protein